MSSVSPTERLALALLCLGPRQRAILAEVAELSSSLGRPVRLMDLRGGRARTTRGNLQVVLAGLWGQWLLVRTCPPTVRGRRGHPRYGPAEDVTNLLDRLPLPRGDHGGHRADPADGVAILAAARALAADGIRPSCRTIQAECGRNVSTVARWARRLKVSGFWPDAAGLRGVQGIARVRDRQRREKAAAPPIESHRKDAYARKVYRAVVPG